MAEGKRVVPSLLAHYLVGLAVCFAYAFSQTDSTGLIPPFIFSYRVRTAVILFSSFMPALQISGILVGYALSFSRRADENVSRWSQSLFSWLKEAFGITLIALGVFVLMAEGISPVMAARREAAKARSEDYRDYLTVSRMALIRGDPKEAEFRIRSALGIWKDSPEALKISEECKLRLAERAGGKDVPDATPAPDPLTAGSPSGLTVVEAMDRSIAAEKALDFYNAHYYATLAARLAKPNDPNREAALRMASNAWNRITEGSDALRSKGDARLYDDKQKGYQAIQSGDYLTAYYAFLGLSVDDDAKGDGKHDPDIARFLEVARRGVLESFFFIDETESLRLFESSRDLFFLLHRPDGGTDAVFVRGVTYTRSSGSDVAYLRDLELARFDRANRLQYRMRVPNAKMFAFAPDGTDPRPQVLLRAVDRARSGVRVAPSVLEGVAPEQDTSVLLLDMPYRDFNLIVSANRGPSTMILADLFMFADRAGKYGFERESYLREALTRLADPFLMLIISVLALVAGWKYRLGKGSLFMAWWALVLPLFPICSLLAIEVVRYLAGLVIVAFVAVMPDRAMTFTAVALGCLFAASSMYFLSQRSD